MFSNVPQQPIQPTDGSDMTETPKPRKKMHFQVHAMPEKFHAYKGESSAPSGFEQPGPKKKGMDMGKIVIIVIVAVVVIGLGVIGYLFFKRSAETNTNTNAVANANANLNGAPNLNILNQNTNNANKNANANGNANLNMNSSNTNTANGNTNNANGNTNNTNTGATKPLSQYANSQDLDGDGLTDIEEETYSTTKTSADTDADGFQDGQELSYGYSPIAKTKLKGSAIVEVHTDPTYNFSVLYPATWQVQSRGAATGGVRMISPEGIEYIDITIEENSARLSALDWYIRQVTNVNASNLSTFQTWDKSAFAVQSVDGFSTYFAKDNYIVVITYSVGTKQTVDYRQTYSMVAKSLEFTNPVIINTNNANSNTNNTNNINNLFNYNTNNTNGNTNNTNNTNS